MEALGDDGLLIVTADHGCDPTYRGTDHTREYIPALLWHRGISPRNAGTRATFADIGATLLDWFGVPPAPIGKSIFD
jgi:phosphopentomutase